MRQSRDADNVLYVQNTKLVWKYHSKCVCYRKKNSHGDHRDILKPDAVKMHKDGVSSEMCELKTVSRPVIRAVLTCSKVTAPRTYTAFCTQPALARSMRLLSEEWE